MNRSALGFGLALASSSALLASRGSAEPFSYDPPGQLVPGSGEGRVDNKVYAPGIRFPIEAAPAFANSQVWGVGGNYGPSGSQCDIANFSYPWHDNYCETRDWDMPLCPAGIGHQGQDIRAASCEGSVHWAVAADDGTITNVGSYSVYVTRADGTRLDYLHMSDVQVAVGQKVTKGQRVGKVSNQFNGTPTSVHLHFNIRQNVQGVGNVYVPPYLSLVGSYSELVGPVSAPPIGALDTVECTAIRGWSQDPDAPTKTTQARVWFDGTPDKEPYNGVTLDADLAHDDCGDKATCKNGFETGLPVHVLDGVEHTVRAYGVDSDGGADGELDGSPQKLTCKRTIPTGIRRLVVNSASFGAWHFSTFWDVLELTDKELEVIPTGDDLPLAPRIAKSDDGSPEVWLIDGDVRRQLPNEDVAAAWEIDLGAAEELGAGELGALEQGPDLRDRPFIAKSKKGELWLVDADPSEPPGATGSGSGQSALKGASEGEADTGCACGLAPNQGGSRAWFGLSVAIGLAARLRRRKR